MFFNERMAVGAAWAQAGRDYMQDAFNITLGGTARYNPLDFFGVFDGHGPNGELIAREVAFNLCDEVVRHYEADKSYTFAEAIEMGCILIDDRMRSDPSLMVEGDNVVYGGSTGCAVWIKEGQIYSANVGDSRFILSYKGRAIPITVDHKPTDAPERERIEKAGGSVSDDDRVEGVLGVSRSFGDYVFKKDKGLQAHQQMVSAVPDVRTVEIDDNIDFLVAATDGVFDAMSNEKVVQAINEGMMESLPLNTICAEVIESCKMPIDPVTGMGSDNMTMILAIFLP